MSGINSGNGFNWKSRLEPLTIANVQLFGARGNVKVVFDGEIISGTSLITSITADFTPDIEGEKVMIRGAAASGLPLVSTIISVISPTQIIIAANASVTVSGKELNYGGVDETEFIQAAVDYLISIGGGELYFPGGRYWIEGTVYINPTTQIPITIKGCTIVVLQDGWARSSNASSILRTVPGDIFRVNMDVNGNGVMIYPNQYMGFAVEGISFVSKSDVAGIVGIKEFRTRGSHKNLAGYKIDRVIQQPLLDASGNETYCDMSHFERIMISNSLLGGIFLCHSDATVINGFYYEGPLETAKFGLEIEKCTTLQAHGLLCWGGGGFHTTISGGSFISINGSFGVKLSGIHLERYKFDAAIYVNNSGATTITNIFTHLLGGNTFKLSYCRGVDINGWYEYATKDPGTYDIIFGATADDNSDITWDNITLYDRSIAVAGSTNTRELIIQNIENRGKLNRRIERVKTTDINTLQGTCIFSSTSSPSNAPAGANFVNGIKFTTNDDENFGSIFCMADNVPYRRTKTGGGYLSWYRILDENDLFVTVSDFNTPTGFKRLKGESTATNSPVSGRYWQGNQFAANNDANYFNQLLFDTQGNFVIRNKNSGTVGNYEVVTAWKFTTLTGNTNIQSGLKSEIFEVNTSTAMTQTLFADANTLPGVIKVFRNINTSTLTIQCGASMTIDGVSKAITMAESGDCLMLLLVGTNKYVEVYRNFVGCENLTDAATILVDAARGEELRVTLGASRVLGSPGNSKRGKKLRFRIKQDGTGSRLITWGASYRFNTSFPSPTLSTAANTTDIVEFVYNETDAKWDCVGFVKGII